MSDCLTTLQFETAENEIIKVITEMNEGDERHLFCAQDFSGILINIVNTQFAHLPLKAKLMSQNDEGLTIKVKYPRNGEGCCGCCS